MMWRNGVLDDDDDADCDADSFLDAVMVRPLSDSVDDECLFLVLDDALDEGCDD